MKKFNYKLLEYILKTDFFLLDKIHKKTNLVVTSLNKSFDILDIIKLIVSLKQIVRLLQFSKKCQNLKAINIVNLKNSQSNIFKFLLVNNNKFFKNKFIISDTFKTNNPGFDYLNLFILINFNNRKVFKNLSYIVEISEVIAKLNLGSYKLVNRLSSFKKFIFFVVLFINVLKRNHAKTTKISKI